MKDFLNASMIIITQIIILELKEKIDLFAVNVMKNIHYQI